MFNTCRAAGSLGFILSLDFWRPQGLKDMLAEVRQARDAWQAQAERLALPAVVAQDFFRLHDNELQGLAAALGLNNSARAPRRRLILTRPNAGKGNGS
jgi:hypothetical protein